MEQDNSIRSYCCLAHCSLQHRFPFILRYLYFSRPGSKTSNTPLLVGLNATTHQNTILVVKMKITDELELIERKEDGDYNE